ncbi:MAG: tRNA (adenosine(37)-N6)-threonylcarbamoyltransferase complex dimerization subunit type 1 TsaB [Clostridiaceae bacterium]|jgi:tRNA threonylcarbamoyladenosine biosynthesis protein TsaB|nr:tRNA (adenosine(37)-N6)-threonylcarbamoyltransferase complex dimerization subunit type 1 TsaB [Clostridiaceae bacterium]
MLILASDTSGKSLSVALCDEESIIAEATLNLGYKHSVTYQPLIADLLARSNRRKEEIDLFVCATGPGSFTGIRIGIAAVKTMAWALNKPAVGVSSLEVLAAAFPGSMVCPAIDARSGRVFSALYDNGDNLQELIIPANHQAADLWTAISQLELCQHQMIVVGDGLPAVKSAYPGEYRSLPKTLWTGPEFWPPRASILSRLGLTKYRDGESGDPLALMPQYLALSQAERIKKQQEQA